MPTFLKKIKQYEHLNIIGFHAHLYSRCRSPKPYVDLVNSLYKVYEIAEKIGMEIEFINIGGGFDSRYLIERETSCDNFFSRISLTLNELNNDLWLYIEPGRYLVNDAGICLTRIVTKKRNMTKQWGIVDIGSNFLVPTKNAYFEAIPQYLNRSITEEKINIAGGICSTADTICENLKIPTVKEGDILAILNCGGYTINLSSNFIYLRPTIVLVNGYKIKILKQSENFGDAKYVF